MVHHSFYIVLTMHGEFNCGRFVDHRRYDPIYVQEHYDTRKCRPWGAHREHCLARRKRTKTAASENLPFAHCVVRGVSEGGFGGGEHALRLLEARASRRLWRTLQSLRSEDNVANKRELASRTDLYEEINRLHKRLERLQREPPLERPTSAFLESEEMKTRLLAFFDAWNGHSLPGT